MTTEDGHVSEYNQDSTEARLAYVVGRLNRHMLAATGGLSHGLLTALATVAQRGPLRIADLGSFELVSAPGITRIVADLESRGLVARNPDPADGRAVLVTITDSGRDAILRAREARTVVIGDLFETATDADDLRAIAAALPALEKLIGGGLPAHT